MSDLAQSASEANSSLGMLHEKYFIAFIRASILNTSVVLLVLLLFFQPQAFVLTCIAVAAVTCFGFVHVLMSIKRPLGAKMLFCIGSTFILMSASVSYPGISALLGAHLIYLMLPLLLFSLRRERRSIVALTIFNFVLLGLSVAYVSSSFRFAFSQGASEDTGLLNGVTAFMAVTFEFLYTFLFTYMNAMANDTIEEQKRGIESQRHAMAQILTNINEGLFTVAANGKIEPNHSLWLLKFLGISSIQGLSVNEVLLDISNISSADRAKIEAVLLTISENLVTFESNASVMPLKLNLSVAGKSKDIELNWVPIAKDRVLEKVLFTIRDLTEEQRLKSDLDRRNEEFSLLTTMINSGINQSIEVLIDSQSMLKNCLQAPERASLLSTIHTVKGNALTIGLRAFAAQAHAIETLIQSQSTFDAEGEGVKKTRELQQVVRHYLYVVDKHLGSVMSTDDFSRVQTVPLAKILNKTAEMLKDLCLARGLAPINVLVEEEVPALSGSMTRFVQSVLGHCFRNSVAHGIERPEARLARGKNPVGTIRIKVGIEDQWVVIRYADDGRGLDLGKIHAIGMAKGILDAQANDNEISEAIFQPEFSTSEHADEIAGRGIGMEAIRSLVTREKGSTLLEFTGQKDELGFRPFAIVFKMPFLRETARNAAIGTLNEI